MSKMIAKQKLDDDEYLVPVTWEMCGFVVVRADTPEEAYDKVLNDTEDFALPCDKTYVDASFAPSFGTPEMVEEYTKMYNNGKLNILIDRDYKELHS